MHFYSRPCGRGDMHRVRQPACSQNFYSRPCGRGDACGAVRRAGMLYFYSRPCGRGDAPMRPAFRDAGIISTHAPAGGATRKATRRATPEAYFYSRPCGRGDNAPSPATGLQSKFLLTPLREGRPVAGRQPPAAADISTHAPAGGATGSITMQFPGLTIISTHAPAGGATAAARTTLHCF